MKDKDLIRILITPILVIAGIVAVLIIFYQTMKIMPQGVSADAMKEIAGVAGTAIAMIGTLVGFIAGHTAGAAGREKAEDRAMDAMEQKMKAEKGMDVLWGMEPEMMESARQKRPDLF